MSMPWPQRPRRDPALTCRPRNVDAARVRLPPDRRLDVLALCKDRRILNGMLEQLQQSGFGIDVAKTVTEARAAFFGAGGHHCLVIAPDVAPGIAGQVMHTLRAVDPELPTATFGPRLDAERAPSRTAMLAGFHPSSRAGVGAFLRFLRELPERG